jgi:hypothetical protein
MKLTITYDDRELIVTGEYHRGYSATWTDPAEPESFEVYRVMDRDVDVTEILENEALDEIAELALQACGDEQEYARDSYYEGLREEQLLGARA